jgi:hypothetical protein
MWFCCSSDLLNFYLIFFATLDACGVDVLTALLSLWRQLESCLSSVNWQLNTSKGGWGMAVVHLAERRTGLKMPSAGNWDITLVMPLSPYSSPYIALPGNNDTSMAILEKGTSSVCSGLVNTTTANRFMGGQLSTGPLLLLCFMTVLVLSLPTKSEYLRPNDL